MEKIQNDDTIIIAPITILGDEIVSNIDLNYEMLLPTILAQDTSVNDTAYRYIINQLINANMFDIYNIFSIKILNCFNNKDLYNILLFELKRFNETQQVRYYLETQLSKLKDLDLNNTSNRDSLISILFTALLNTLDYMSQFIVSSILIELNAGFDSKDILYKDCLKKYELKDTKKVLSLNDKYVFCLNLFRQSINSFSQDMYTACALIIDLAYNINIIKANNKEDI